MTVAVSGDSITFDDNSKQTSAQVGMKNRLINGVFILNQRGYVSGTALASGAYGHDRFKAGASGCTYTFTQAALGVPTTITITVGSLIQIIEGCNVPEGGAYVLSWTGSAQARLNGGAYGASGTVLVSSWAAGTNLPVEFSTGTVSSVQLEKGSTASTYDFRDYGRELMMCQRYYENSFDAGNRPGVSVSLTDAIHLVSWGDGNCMGFPFQVPMRAPPTITLRAQESTVTGQVSSNGVLRSASAVSAGVKQVSFINVTTGAANAYTRFTWEASAEL